MVAPDEREHYELGDASIVIDRFNAPLRTTYWVGNAVGSVEFDEENFYNLAELIDHFNEDTREDDDGFQIDRVALAGGFAIGCLVMMLIVMVAGG